MFQQSIFLWLPLIALTLLQFSSKISVEAFSNRNTEWSKKGQCSTNPICRPINPLPVVRTHFSTGIAFPFLSRPGPGTLLKASSEDNKNDWFFKPLISDSPAPNRVNTSQGKRSRLDLSRIVTLVKPDSNDEDERNRPAKNAKAKKPAAVSKKQQASPLSEIEETSSFLDLSNPQTIFGIAAIAGISAVTAISYSLGLTPDDFLHGAQTLLTDPQKFSQELLEGVKGLGPTGVIYFALIYMIAEILAVPATPLTLSAGYLFGIQQGILAVLAGATGAACIGFWISRTFLRDYVESTLLSPSTGTNGEKSSSTLIKLDKAIGEEGFKLLVLIRLSPIFPFSVTNYLYGASSIGFGPYILGTLIGFVPTTAAYVYTGMVGQALTGGNGMDQPWYVYAGGFSVLALLVKLVTDVATGIIEAIDEES